MSNITALELKKKLDKREKIFILDVREPVEYQYCRIDGSKLIPLGQLPEKFKELDKTKEIIVHCHHGIRGAEAMKFLKKKGFKKVKNLKGGIDAWSKEIDPSVPTY